MNKIVTKSGLSRKCLMSFIIFYCSMFIIEDAFSKQHWQRSNMILSYDKKNKSIIFDFLFYYYLPHLNFHSFLSLCNFQYSEDGINYTPLMTVESKKQYFNKRKVLTMSQKQRGEKIQFFNCLAPKSGTYWLKDEPDVKVVVPVKSERYNEGLIWAERRKSFSSITWHLPIHFRSIKSIRLTGTWSVSGKGREKIEEDYILDIVSSHSIIINDIPYELNSELNYKVKVTGETDAINVKGVEPGEKIKVYTTTGAEIISVVANDDVVNIKLPKNQMYIVKAGQARCKVAM